MSKIGEKQSLELALAELDGLQQGLRTKQGYLAKGTIPKNLPLSNFLEEDIRALDFALGLLKKNLDLTRFS